MSRQSAVLCIFTKTPVPGTVKTRLIPQLGEHGACELYRSLLLRTLETACASGIDRIRLYCTPITEHPFLLRCAGQFNIELCVQDGIDLGERMCNALADGLDEHDFALVLGCDCPWLTTGDLVLACESLRKGTEVVLGPATDGGYYLLGLSTLHRGLFAHMPWGSAGVLAETQRRLSSAGLRWEELAEHPDLDRPEDLLAYERFLAASGTSLPELSGTGQ